MKKEETNAPDFDQSLLTASAESALSALQQAGASGEALVERWVKAGNIAAVAVVAERGNGAARKAARRGINVLKARGMTVPAERRVAALVGKTEEQLEAFMVPPDASGNQLFVVAARSRESRYRAAIVFLNDAAGLQRVDYAELSQSQLREAIARVVQSADYKPLKVPVEWARARVSLAKARHAERRIPLPLGYGTASALLEPAPATLPSHPFEEEGLELADDDARELAKSSITLHSLPEFRAWLPPKPLVDELLAKVGEGLTPGQEPAPEDLRARIDEQIRAATDRFFSPERRAGLTSSMKDCALSVLAREGEQRALDVAAAIKVIQNAGLITDPPHEIGFLRGFFEKAISVLLAQGGGNLRIPVPQRAPAEPAPSGGQAPAEAAPETGESAPTETSTQSAE